MKRPGGKVSNIFEEKDCVIGIDQSYTRTGISVCYKGVIKFVKSLDFKGMNCKTQRREEVRKILDKLIKVCIKKYGEGNIVIIVERIRTFTQGADLRPDVIKAHSALVATIVDIGYLNGVRTFSVDTRVWKTKILGTSKPIFPPIEGVKNPQKFGSVKKAIDLGFKEQITCKKGRMGKFSLNDDVADAICISLYGCSGKPYKLLLEK